MAMATEISTGRARTGSVPHCQNSGATLHYLPSVMDTLSVEMGHTPGHFQSVKSRICQVYQLLVGGAQPPRPPALAGSRRYRVRNVGAPFLTVSQPQRQSLQARPSIATCMCLNSSGANSWGHPQQLSEKPRLQSKSDIDTITAMDIPYTLRHFDCDISAAVNISEGTSRRVTGGGTGGTVSFSLSEGRTTCARSRVSFENSKSDAPQRAVLSRDCRSPGDSAADFDCASSSEGGSDSRRQRQCLLASAASKAASSTVSSRTSSPSGLPMLKCHVFGPRRRRQMQRFKELDRADSPDSGWCDGRQQLKSGNQYSDEQRSAIVVCVNGWHPRSLVGLPAPSATAKPVKQLEASESGRLVPEAPGPIERPSERILLRSLRFSALFAPPFATLSAGVWRRRVGPP
uniref:PID domain-containing protein n=1 Tax=Macrostomum lignano TaxID=282301 RepID=A0A1I8FFD8_9PLAT